MSDTRDALHRTATHVLSRARHAATGKIGLRATPGGFGTPAFGDAIEVLRVAGSVLIRERDGRASFATLEGSTLTELAAFAGVSLDEPFDAAGADAPDIGDADAPLSLDREECEVLSEWWHLGWRALDTVCAHSRDAMAIQLWPEHFDAGTSVATGPGKKDRCNLGVSPGDSSIDEPYLYVGPWGDERPDDATYWNAPFGAVRTRTEMLSAPDLYTAAVSFFERGVRLLDGDQ